MDSSDIWDAPTVVENVEREKVRTQIVRVRKRRPLPLLPAGEAITHLAELGECWGDLVSDLIAPASPAQPAGELSGRSILDEVSSK